MRTIKKKIYNSQNKKKLSRNKKKLSRNNKKLSRNNKKKLSGGASNVDYEMTLMENLYKQSCKDEQIDDKIIDDLLVKVENNQELYDSIYNINLVLKSDCNKKIYLERAQKFAANIYRFQEDPKESHFMEKCKYGNKCTRKNILHKLTHPPHNFLHKATFIAHSILTLAGLYKV